MHEVFIERFLRRQSIEMRYPRRKRKKQETQCGHLCGPIVDANAKPTTKPRAPGSGPHSVSGSVSCRNPFQVPTTSNKTKNTMRVKQPSEDQTA